jgi:hypothetical protein
MNVKKERLQSKRKNVEEWYVDGAEALAGE